MSNLVFSGKYLVQEVIGQGELGVVYKALDRTMNQVVAIKVAHTHLLRVPSFIERLLGEARSMARLDHENIVTIHEVDENQGTPLLVMEYVSGSNLQTFMQTHKPLPLGTSLAIAVQVADALAYAHEQHIVHRGIKPSNILVDSRTRVKLTDFGISAVADEISSRSDGLVLDRKDYRSPEQTHRQAVDERTDLYSLGIVLYKMVVGHHPIGNTPKPAIQSLARDADQEIHPTFPPTVPSLVKAIIEDLLRQNRDHRTPTARLLVSQLKECLHTQSLPFEVSAESDTIVVLPSHHRQTEQQRPPVVMLTAEQPTRSFPIPTLETPHARTRTDDPIPSLPASLEDKADPAPQQPAQRTSVPPYAPQSFVEKYDLRPLVGIALVGALALGGLLLYVLVGDRRQLSEPPPQHAPQANTRPAAEMSIKDEGRVPEAGGPESVGNIVPSPSVQSTELWPNAAPPGISNLLASSRQQLEQRLKDFQAAYEKLDWPSLQRVSKISPDRQIFLNIMANNYSTIKVSIQDISIQNNRATATLVHEELADREGLPVAPDTILRRAGISIDKEGDRWGKVNW